MSFRSETDDGKARRDNGTCPLPVSSYDRIMLGHGGGGLLSAQLIARLFLPAYGNDVLAALEDQATVGLPGRRWNRRRRGSPSRPIRSSSVRSSSPAATSASWRCMARSTTWPSAGPRRST